MSHEMTHPAHEKTTSPHAGHTMPEMHAAHDRHAGHSVAMFRDKFWLSFALTIPVVVWSREVQHWLGYTAPTFAGKNVDPGNVHLAVRRPRLPARCAWRARRPPARDDDSDQLGDH